MANSGRAEEALEYYYRALDLNPAYVRARLVDFVNSVVKQKVDAQNLRYNLGISCIQLKVYISLVLFLTLRILILRWLQRYNEGALHILDALSLQDAEGVHDVEGFNDARGGITSNALWDSLKTACLHLQRVDLATLCDKRDVEGPEPMQMGEHTITQKHLYTALFVIGLPLLFIASPVMTFFWLVGASGVLILGHASFIEPGIESEYAAVQDTV
ncbi:hypothetical protein HHX47_DHR3000705 [Lentinula edodes]|nr:hypothetical protein HHX47_DHR3000705 [Lentinula edodes]